MQKDYRLQSRKVADYYNKWQNQYNDIYGDTIQAFRPAKKDELMSYIAASAGIANGMNILDAGCGVAGPIIWFMKHYNATITGITISETQMEQAKKAIAEKAPSSKAEIVLGDYHELEDFFSENAFDLILFLESLGHAGDVFKVISSSYKVLKPGGSIYIKDFYYKELNNAYWNKRIENVISNINELYSYNTLSLNHTITALRSTGFEIDFIRKFTFVDDISIRQEFEKKAGINIFDEDGEFYPAEWLEIKCIKPAL